MNSKMSGQLPLQKPEYNLREVCKQIILLEDHLNHPEKRCADCITKHFLAAEALAEEAVSLDTEGKYPGLKKLPAVLRALQQDWWGDKDECEVAQGLRKIRKKYQKETFKVRSASFVAATHMARATHICGR